jgi:hypothetical protein
MRKALRYIAASGLLMTALAAPPVFADTPTDANCWGTVVSQRATTSHDIGEHSSSQSEPRLGLGNVAALLGFDSVGELGAFLASVDEDPATHCP